MPGRGSRKRSVKLSVEIEMTQFDVKLNDAGDRYEVFVDGKAGGFVQVLASDSHVAFTHTEVDPEFKGRGLGKRLAEASLADAVDKGKSIIPLCPFIATYLTEHPIEGAQVEWPNRPPAE